MTAFRHLAAAGLLACLGGAFFGCENPSYDSGTGANSLLQADFVEAFTDGGAQVTAVETDDGTRLALTQPLTASWITRPDTAYRSVLYYNKEAEGRAMPVSLVSVPTLVPHPLKAGEEMKAHPITFESIWQSKDGKYINIAFYLKVADVDDEAVRQTIGVIDEGRREHPDGTVTARLRFYHDQGGMPEYFSQKYYVSILCTGLECDSVEVSLSTYSGDRTWITGS